MVIFNENRMVYNFTWISTIVANLRAEQNKHLISETHNAGDQKLIFKKILIIHRGKHNNYLVLSIASRCSHFWDDTVTPLEIQSDSKIYN